MAIDEDLIAQALSEIGRRGGVVRARKLSAEKRKEIATEASKAAAKKRSAEAKKRKRKKQR